MHLEGANGDSPSRSLGWAREQDSLFARRYTGVKQITIVKIEN